MRRVLCRNIPSVFSKSSASESTFITESLGTTSGTGRRPHEIYEIVGAVGRCYCWRKCCDLPRRTSEERNQDCDGLPPKGDEPNEYSITDISGKTYEMRSSEVKLADHLGYKVTVTGHLKGEKDEDEESEAKGSKKEAGYIQVTKLTLVSTSCQ